MSPRWAAVGSAVLYFYADEPHQRPHVDVVGPDWDVKIALDDLAILDRSGKVPAATLRDVVKLLREHRHLAVEAFQATRAHRFPGTLAKQLEADNER